MNLKFYKMREMAKMPHRAHSTDAGMDVFYCPDLQNDNKCVWEPGHKFKIPAGENCLIPTGIKVDLPEGFMLEVKNKSCIASKKQLLVGACVIDPGYTGEIYINLHNVGRVAQEISPGQKVAQMVLVPIEVCKVEQTFTDPAEKKTMRSTGGFGSTGEF